ncbi:hypothetical protein Pcinc_008571 [Petrolisthes cinctipes]|uniref:Uncharacterized protein n=1 Tax=Petrolisthes cinctipes TaxID=88211 RepID=A0AAE1G6X7_PETCI|nr:hypothetical protein Pcinc_008571 [Petrolisthes cinctipes]
MPKQDKNLEGKRTGSGKKATAPAGEWGNAAALASSAAFGVSRQAKIKTNKRTDAGKRAKALVESKANAQELLRQGIAVKPPLPSSQPVAATPLCMEVTVEREDVPTSSALEEDITMSGDEGTRQEGGREQPSAKEELLEEAVTSGSPGGTSKCKRKVGTPLSPRQPVKVPKSELQECLKESLTDIETLVGEKEKIASSKDKVQIEVNWLHRDLELLRRLDKNVQYCIRGSHTQLPHLKQQNPEGLLTTTDTRR